MHENENENDDGLVVNRIAGGSTIDHPPVFSPDGELIFVIYENIVHSYSTVTGEWVRDLEGAKSAIVNIQYENSNCKFLFACTTTGEVLKWKWKTGALEHRTKLPLQNCKIESFYLVNASPNALCAFVMYSSSSHGHLMAVVDITNGKVMNNGFMAELKNSDCKTIVDVEKRNFHYIAIVHESSLHVVNYKNWDYKKWHNAQNEWFSFVRCHPTEEMVATGDSLGRIFLWRNIYKARQPYTTLFHWHHTPITSISFTESGTNFYSSGLEAVLVKWNIKRPDLQEFLPRVPDAILHIAISDENKKVAIGMADNAIQILGAQNKALCVLQKFTFVSDRKTGLHRFPIGLQINPRMKTLALNGRVGHIQFYSTYTRSLLYNMDIVLQNKMSLESKKILYDIRVTKAAFNVNWMATCEEWDDQEHNVETRLKFWEFKNESQNYELNSNIESAHVGGFSAIVFSSQYQSENLSCVTVGKDNMIKLWSLEDSSNIYKKGKVWYCISKSSYKNLPIESVHFSQDGSLLAAGFGNTLCIYKADSLTLKVALTAPPGIDGTLAKTTILLPKGSIKKSTKSPVKSPAKQKDQNRDATLKNILNLFQSFASSNRSELVERLKNSKRLKITADDDGVKPVSSIKLNNTQKEIVFKKILSLPDLNLFQKVDLYQKLEIYCSVNGRAKERVKNYMKQNILSSKKKEVELRNYIKRISTKNKFKAKYMFENYVSRKSNWNLWSHKQLASIFNIMNFGDEPTPSGVRRRSLRKSVDSSKQNGFLQNGDQGSNGDDMIETLKQEKVIPPPPLQDLAHIKFILFGAKEYAHLVVVCTKHRVLIWDLLTLRLQSVLKLSVEQIAVDPMTGLYAIFTIYNELYVFLPNAPIPLYHRTNLPKIHGAAWVPRRVPKSQSLNIDWQAISFLYFLTDKQEICCLLSEKDTDSLVATATFSNELQDSKFSSVFGRYAVNQMNGNNANYTEKSKNISIGVPGKASVKALIETATHTMAPVNLLCKSFIKSLLVIEDDMKRDTGNNNDSEDDEDVQMDSDEDDKFSDSEVNKKIATRKSRMAKSEQSVGKQKSSKDRNYQSILKETIDIEF